jgi:exodeoxyribonuclease VII small subunit
MINPSPSPPDTAADAGPALGATPEGAPERTYEEASARLEVIVRRLDSTEAGLRETLELCREGRALVERCAAELEEVGQGLEELRLDELVTRLEARA